MEQNEQTAAAETVAENKSENSGNGGAAENLVTERMAIIKIEGQDLELEAALAEDDKMLKAVLQPYYSSVENATITRDVKEGKLTVTIVKKAQHKG